jgi:hypothetical protein
MEPMTSTRSSKAVALALAALALAAVAAPAAAVSVGDSDIPGEAETGTQVSASYTLTTLYQGPNWEPWTLQGETELQNVSWTLTFIDAQGNQFDTVSYSGQTFTSEPITTDRDILEVRVEVTGVVPPLEESELSYPEEETFDLATLTQYQGESTTGASNQIATNETHKFTTADENEADPEPGSQEARAALDEARQAIQDAEAAGADTSDANETFTAAVSSYENGDFSNAVSLAGSAQEEAETAQNQLESNQQRNQLLLYGAGALVVLALVGGGVFYFRNQGDDYDKLG